jgi:hypothetical protein
MIPKKCPACKQQTLSYDEEYLFCTNCPIYRKPLTIIQKPFAWASKRFWWWRLPIFLWFVYVLVLNMRDSSFAMRRLRDPLTALDLGIHELGHVLFQPFGQFMAIAGGSIFQLLFPLLWLVGFLQKKWYFAASMCWCWLGMNFFDVATYAADARVRLLPLATGLAGLYEQGSDETYDRAHDWYQMLSRLGKLDMDLAIARGLRIAGITCFIIGIVTGALLLMQMVISSFTKARKAQ